MSHRVEALLRGSREASFQSRGRGFQNSQFRSGLEVPACAPNGFEPDMPTEFADDGTIDELLRLAGVSTEASAARCWLKSALAAARGQLERRLAATGATRVPLPSPAKHNAPLDKVEQATDRLIAALEELRRHPHAHASFWRFEAFGPVCASELERADAIPTLTNIRDAARKARVSRTGRPRNFRKQQIVDLALAFCARFSPKRPSNDVNNFFPPFVCEVHYRYHKDKPTNDELEQEAAHLFPRVVPDGMKLTLFCWRKKPAERISTTATY